MKEIEVKARVKDPASLKKKLEARNCHFSNPIRQVDRIFLHEHGSIPARQGENVLRIREQNGKFLFTLKQTQANQLDCIEEEMTIADPVTLVNIMKLLHFNESLGVTKTRQTATYQDYTICLDEVKGLGTYIEVETFAEADGPTVQEQLFAFLQTLGITKEDQEMNGYDVLLHQKIRQTK